MCYSDMTVNDAINKNNPTILFDTIKCKIDSLAGGELFYTNKRGKAKTMDIHKVISYCEDKKVVPISYNMIVIKDSTSYDIIQHIHK